MLDRDRHPVLTHLFRVTAFILWPAACAVYAAALYKIKAVVLLYGIDSEPLADAAAIVMAVAALAALVSPHRWIPPRLALLVAGGWVFAGRMWTIAITGIGVGPAGYWGRALGTATYGMLALAHVIMTSLAVMLRGRNDFR